MKFFPLPKGSYNWTSPWGVRQDPTGRKGLSFHYGVDLAPKVPGQQLPIYAPDDSVVTTGYEANGAGNWIWLHRGDGKTWKFFHLSSYAVFNGQRVMAGQVVGYMGTTGASTGVHTHVELHDQWPPSHAVDPTAELRDAEARNAFVGEAPEPEPIPEPEPVPEEDDDVKPVILRDRDDNLRSYLWAGERPAPTSDIQIQYATTLWGKGEPLAVYEVNGAFITELRG